MKKIYPFLIGLLCINCALAQMKQPVVTKSSVVFHIKNLGITIDGKLAGFKGDIKFDPANLAGSTIDASVDVNTIDTDNGTRNDHLKSESFFDAAKYPTISMKSAGFTHSSGNNYKGTFNLTIKNITKTVEIPFSYVETGNTGVFKGNFQIERSDYGVGGSSLVMSDNVKVDLEVTTIR
ncbi:MAG: YceI family protein [Bacteroidetes bacterium]|nr:YceI family protein [Bacteroidota bacterium]